MITTVPPRAVMLIEKRNGAAWYIGAGERYTDSVVTPNSSCRTPVTPNGNVSRGSGTNALVTPFGSPVVPDEYSMSAPAIRLGSGAAGWAAMAASKDS